MDAQEIRFFREKIRRLQRDAGWQMRSDSICCGVTAAQCHVLLELVKQGEISLVELSAILGLDTSTLSRTVDGMVQAGLVERLPNPRDRRYISIFLTEQGRTVSAEIDSKYNDFYAGVFERIPEQKRRQVLESIGLLADAVHGYAGCCCNCENREGLKK